jgi:hypothetical protein
LPFTTAMYLVSTNKCKDVMAIGSRQKEENH